MAVGSVPLITCNNFSESIILIIEDSHPEVVMIKHNRRIKQLSSKSFQSFKIINISNNQLYYFKAIF